MDEETSYYVYVLKSVHDNYHYIGHTQNISERLKTHNSKKVKSTKAHAPYELIYTEKYSSRSDAATREFYLKKAQGNIWLRQYLTDLGLW